MTTKKLISDQVLYALSGGVPDAAFPVDERDIWKATEQKINSLYKLRQFDTTLPSGETIPEFAMIATYTGIAVTSLGNGKSKSILPITPISLPKNVGVYLIYHADYPDTPFIPIQSGQQALLKTDTLLNDLLGQIAYYPKQNTIIYSKDITFFGMTAVTMELCVLDMSQYGISDMLPIPASMEEQIVQELIKQFSPITPETGGVNNITTLGQNQPA